MGVGGVSEDVKLSNNSVGDGAGNQDNRRATVKDMEDSDDVVVDLTDGVLADVLAHLFGPLSLRSNSPPGVTAAPTDGVLANVLAHPFGHSSPRSNSPPGVTAACSVRSHGNKFQFLFISLLTLLQGLTKFLMSGVVVWLALPAPSPHRSGAKRFVAATTRAFSMGCICLLASNTCV